MVEPGWFIPLYIGSGIWQEVGWGSIIFLAALAGINPSLYEAAEVDGAGRWRKMFHITLPGLAPTVIVMLILRIGQVMSIGLEKVLLMYNPAIYETADIIQTYVYREGILNANYGYAAAVGMFNSVVAFILIIVANRISAKVSETSLW